jgi:quercetin dioxygenase-like cupin family protein
VTPSRYNNHRQEATLMPHDPVKVDSKHYKVEVENDTVRVLRIRYGPREKSSMHGHPASIAVAITDAHAKFSFPDGTSQEMHMSQGQVMAIPAGDHLPENIGDKPFEVILVELKG